MAHEKHSDSSLIDAIGSRVVVERFGLTPQRLHMWRKRGIPVAARVAFARLCAEHGVPTPSDFFEKFAA